MNRNLLLSLSVLIFSLGACTAPTLEQRADALHKKMITLDSHNDTPLRFSLEGFDFMKENEGICVDLPKMQQGGLDGAFFAAFVRQGDRNVDGNLAAQQKALSIIADVHALAAQYPDQVELATNSEDIARIKKAGKRALYMGVENGYAIGNDLSMLDTLYNLGVRYVTLVHTKNNDLCDSANDAKGPEFNGLSEFGRKAVVRMNELGLMVDISHASDEAAFEAIALSTTPILASHSCAQAICNVPRNMSDSLLLAMANKGGVVQMCILSSYVRSDLPAGERATVSDAVDHIDHMVNLIGIEHVGIGTDFDGGGGLADCPDASYLKNITIELMRRGYTDQQIKMIWSENVLRVLRAAEAARKA